MLGLSSTNRAAPRPGQPLPPQSFGAARFLMPVQQCEFQLTGILEALARDPWPVANDKRPLRCAGVAVSVAVGLLEVRCLPFKRLPHFETRSDHVPEHRRAHPRLFWRTRYRRPWDGCQQRAEGAYPFPS